jgi:23S rRNA pseudouridine1911/1915/1917 synthase
MRDEELYFEILYEDNHLLAVSKPAMLPTMGVADDRPSLLALAKEYLRGTYYKPGNVYLGVVSRLDAPVTGLVLLAKTSKAASRLSESFRTRRVKKTYLAAVEGRVEPPSDVLEHYLRKDERHRKVHTSHASAPGAQLARLSYRQVRVAGELALLEVDSETGRKHQIRVQLSKIGHSIVGDRKYGSTVALRRGIALHSQALELEHPVRREPLRLEAPLPCMWREHPGIRRLID